MWVCTKFRLGYSGFQEEERMKYHAFSVDPVDYENLLPVLHRTVDALEKFNNGQKTDDMDF